MINYIITMTPGATTTDRTYRKREKESMRMLAKQIQEVLDTNKTDRISKTCSLMTNGKQDLAFKAGF